MQREDGDSGTLGGETLANSQPQTASPAGHERDLPRQATHRCSLVDGPARRNLEIA
jgi:hypothetical protein